MTGMRASRRLAGATGEDGGARCGGERERVPVLLPRLAGATGATVATGEVVAAEEIDGSCVSDS